MPRRKKPRFSHSPGKRLRGQSMRKNPSFLGLLLILAMFAAFYLLRESGLFSDDLNLSGEFAVHFIDIGQGDSILIQSANEFMLIDTGSGSEYPKLANYLEHFGVREFRYVVFTHPHEDHIGSAHRIVREFDIGSLIMPSAVNNTAAFRNLVEAIEDRNVRITLAEPGNTHRLGEAEFMILAPLSEGHANLNNYSVVILMNYGHTRFLFTGDMERQSENELISFAEENLLDISADVLKVAHHGSRSSSQNSFLDLIRPRIAVIQVGADNSYNHPHPQVVENLENIGAEIIRTDLHGDIIISSDGRRLTVHTSRGNYTGRFMPAPETEPEPEMPED